MIDDPFEDTYDCDDGTDDHEEIGWRCVAGIRLVKLVAFIGAVNYPKVGDIARFSCKDDFDSFAVLGFHKEDSVVIVQVG